MHTKKYLQNIGLCKKSNYKSYDIIYLIQKLGKIMNHQILRPNFTNNIFTHYVQKGKSINIFGQEGIGKDRFIEDIKLLMNKDMYCVLLNMRELRVSYDKFLEDLGNQLDIDHKIYSIEEVLAQFQSQQGKKVLLIKNFEYLFEENRDDEFNFDFFDQLNSFKNSNDVSLILISTLNYRHYHYYKGNKLKTSPLDIDVIEITPLIHQEIVSELKKDITENLSFNLLATLIQGKDHPYSLIKLIKREIEFGNYSSDDFLETNFDKWEDKFKKENNIPTIVQVKHNIKKWNFSSFGEFIIRGLKIWKKD